MLCPSPGSFLSRPPRSVGRKAASGGLGPFRHPRACPSPRRACDFSRWSLEVRWDAALAQTGTAAGSAGFTFSVGGPTASEGNSASQNAKGTTFLGVKIYFNFDTASPAGIAYLNDAVNVITSNYGRSVLTEYHTAHPDGEVLVNMNTKAPNNNPAFSAQGPASGQPYLAVISINPNLKYFDQVRRLDGSLAFAQFSTKEVFAHELGHLVTPADSGPNHMDNVNRNENRWRNEVGLPERTDYMNGRITY